MYKRELLYNIKQAYCRYLQASKALDIYNNALATVNESLRFNEKLVKNNTATKEVVLKAKAQVSQVQTSIADGQFTCSSAVRHSILCAEANLWIEQTFCPL